MQPSETLPIADARFIGEQDGDAERLLKQSLIPVLEAHTEIEQAFLARAVLEPGARSTVALCLSASRKSKYAIIEEINLIFAKTFVHGSHLDILFLRPDQLRDVSTVCQPFYLRRKRRILKWLGR